MDSDLVTASRSEILAIILIKTMPPDVKMQSYVSAHVKELKSSNK